LFVLKLIRGCDVRGIKGKARRWIVIFRLSLRVFVSAVSDMQLVFTGSAETFLAIQWRQLILLRVSGSITWTSVKPFHNSAATFLDFEFSSIW